MSDTEVRELRGVCEAFRAALLSQLRISRFRLDVLCSDPSRQSILLVEGRVPRGDRRAAQRRPAVITTPIRDSLGVVGSVTIEDDSRAFLPASARDEIERVGTIYAPMVRACLHAGGSWPRENGSRLARPRAPR